MFQFSLSHYHYVYFERRIHCVPFIGLTPTKNDKKKEENNDDDTERFDDKHNDSETEKTETPNLEVNSNVDTRSDIPGLSLEDIKKAERKEKKKKKKEEKKRLQQEKHTNMSSQIQVASQQKDMSESGEESDDSEGEVVDPLIKKRGFFSRSPLNSLSSYGSCSEELLTPKSFKSNAAKRIEKEELWRQSVGKSINTLKRTMNSPPEGQSSEKLG